VIVRVLFFGILKDLTGLTSDTANVPCGATVTDLFSQYAQRFETLRAARSSILFARNQEFVTPETPLSDNDEVAFLPPVSGGSDAAPSYVAYSHRDGHLFGITRDPIASQAIASTLQRAEDGAVIVFEGVVRNNTKGRPTKYLEYECYEAMALRQMEKIGLEIAASFAIGRIGMVHRLGVLQIGEASVAIIATAPHRRAAFEAALEGINRLKREVPVWKKEYFADGAVWVEGEWDDNLPGRQPAQT
jgi:molybdopterin synthase catalytic subunit